MATRSQNSSTTLPEFTPDRDSPVPLYFQVATHIEGAIVSGAVPPGSVFENELRLADNMGLSRPTMRRAMQHLVDKGLVVRRRGIGTRVVQPKVRRPLELTSLYEDLALAGQQPTTEVLAFEHEPATVEVAEALHLHEDVPIVRIERLRSARDNPIAKMTNYLPERVVDFDADDLRDHGLYELLRARGVQMHAATQTVGARTATAAEARMLKEPQRSALLTMSRLTYDDHGKVVEYATHLYAASRYAFEINLLKP